MRVPGPNLGGYESSPEVIRKSTAEAGLSCAVTKIVKGTQSFEHIA